MEKMTNNPLDKKLLAEFINKTIQQNLADILAEIEGVKDNKDIEYVHRQRISLRRLRNNLQVFRPFGNETYKSFLLELLNHTSPLAFILADARDLDIQLALTGQFFQEANISGLTQFTDTLAKQRLERHSNLLEHFNELNHSQIFDDFLQNLPDYLSKHLLPDTPVLSTIPSRTICSICSQALAQLYLLNPYSGFLELHQFRKTIRRLRYTLECYAAWFPILLIDFIEITHQMQDHLGDLHDLDMLLLSVKHAHPTLMKDSEAFVQIIEGARLPSHTAIIHAIQTNEYRVFLQAILNHFHQQLTLETEQ